MGGDSQIAGWRLRAASRVVAAAVCVAFCALLVLASRTTLTREYAVQGIEVLLSPRTPDETPRPRTSDPRPQAAPTPAIAPMPTVDAEMMSRMLRCFTPQGRARRADCPRQAPPETWRTPDIGVGGDYVQPEQPDLDRIYTRAERSTLVMPSCVRDGAGACVPFGPTPPPPSRSAEQICEEGGLGGPCTPPPFRPEDVQRRRHSQ